MSLMLKILQLRLKCNTLRRSCRIKSISNAQRNLRPINRLSHLVVIMLPRFNSTSTLILNQLNILNVQRCLLVRFLTQAWTAMGSLRITPSQRLCRPLHRVNCPSQLTRVRGRSLITRQRNNHLRRRPTDLKCNRRRTNSIKVNCNCQPTLNSLLPRPQCRQTIKTGRITRANNSRLNPTLAFPLLSNGSRQLRMCLYRPFNTSRSVNKIRDLINQRRSRLLRAMLSTLIDRIT